MKSISPGFPPVVVWSLLVLATGMTFANGEFGSPGPLLISAVLLLAFVKGVLLILDFMELRHAPRLWLLLVIGWMTLVVGGILLAYLR